MASTINATSSGSGGLITTGNSVNQLELQTGDTTRVVIDGSGNVTIQGQGDLRLADSDSSHYVALQAPGTVSSNVTFTLPSADGTSGQVLQTNGSGTLSFATPAGGAWTYLSTVTASGGATADIETTFSSTYDMYAIVATNLRPSSDNANLYCRLKISGSYLSTSTYNYAGLNIGSTSGGWSLNGAALSDTIVIDPRGQGSASTSTSSFVMYVSQPSSTTKIKQIYWIGNGTNDSNNVSWLNGGGNNSGTGALTGVRFYYAAGNVAEGTFRLYGIKNS